jgi:hypothetical protein
MSLDPWRPRPVTREDVLREAGPSACIGCPLAKGCDLAARSGLYAPRCAVLARSTCRGRWAPLSRPVPVTPRGQHRSGGY